MEKQYTVHLTKKQIDVLKLVLIALAQQHRDTVRKLEGDPEYRVTVARCRAGMDTGDVAFVRLCCAICGD